MVAGTPPLPPAPGARPAGIILAGGRGRRLPGIEKALAPLAGRPLVAHVAGRLGPQVAALALSANGDPARFAFLGAAILADEDATRPGPLAGLLAGLNWAAAGGHAALLAVPCDTPFLPADLGLRLAAAAGPGGGAAVAASPDGEGRLRRHPTVGLWPVAARGALRASLARGLRRAGEFADLLGAATATWPAGPADPFLNVNTPGDLARAAARLAAGAGG